MRVDTAAPMTLEDVRVSDDGDAKIDCRDKKDCNKDPAC
jgi:hypothetical protein